MSTVGSLPEPSKLAVDDTFFFYFYPSKKIRLDLSLESSAWMKYQVLLSLKNNEKILKTVVCCSLDWRFKAYKIDLKKGRRQNFRLQIFKMSTSK